MRRTRHDESAETGTNRSVGRRRFLAAGAGIGATLLAGCAGDTGTSSTSTTAATTGSTSADVGAFRLLISDRPADIGDFEKLTVTLSHARVFRSGDVGSDGDDDGEEDVTSTTATTSNQTSTTAATTTNTETTATSTTEATTETSTATTTSSPTDTTTTSSATTTSQTTAEPTTTETSETTTEGSEDGDSGFFTMDLDGASVDLTQVVGEKAIGVLEDELPTGRYTKIELHASDVVGIVEGEEVDVKIPSEKLQLTKPFEVTADEPVSFVFDINVVKKGNEDAYNLQPVISESGVAGTDVQVEEVSSGEENGDGTTSDESAGTETTESDAETSSGTTTESNTTESTTNETTASGSQTATEEA